MKLLRKRDIPEERYTNAFLGYGPEEAHFVIELTYSKLQYIVLNYICLQVVKYIIVNCVLFLFQKKKIVNVSVV